MRTKEKLERSGWRYMIPWEGKRELYGRGFLRIIYDPETQSATHYFDVRIKHMTFLDDLTFEFLTEKA